MRGLALTALCLAAHTSAIAAQPTPANPRSQDPLPILEVRPAEIRAQFETIEVEEGESMGLASLAFLLELGPSLYAGAAGFGALTGERGGFFTGGLLLGARPAPRKGWYPDAGLFFGGGGGGGAPQGGGMMVRLHAGMGLELGRFGVQGGVSWVKFPNGKIDSRQAYFSLSTSFQELYGPASGAGQPIDFSDAAGADLTVVDTEWYAAGGAYLPASDSKTTGGEPMTATLSLVGFEYRRHSRGSRYLIVQAAGASGGRSDGYAEIFTGVGWQWPLVSERVFADLNLTAGGGGGGQVDTSGGLAGKVHLGLAFRLTPSLIVGGSVGRMESAGSFSAESYQARLGYRFGDVRLGAAGRPLEPGELLTATPWRISLGHQTWIEVARKGSDPRDMSLIGLRLDRFLQPSVYVTGQAYGAHSGEAGGYAVGLLGVGVHGKVPGMDRLSVSAEATGGAGGGGGVDVGGGAALQAHGRLHFSATPEAALYLGVGRVLASPDRLDSTLFSLGVSFTLSRTEVRYH